MEGLLAKVAGASTRHPWRVLSIAVIASIPVGVVGSRLSVSTSRTALVSEDNPNWRRYMDFAREFGIPEDLVVVAKGESPEAVRGYLDAVAARLLQDEDQVGAVFYRVDLGIFEERAPLFFDPDQLALLDRFAKMESVARLLDAESPPARIAALAALIDRLPSKLAPDTKPGPEVDQLTGALANLLVEMERFSRADGPKKLTLVDRRTLLRKALAERASGGIDEYGYLTTDDGRTGVMFVRPTYTRDEITVVMPFVAAVREAAEAAREGRGKVRYGLTGIPASSVEELEIIQHDTVLTTAIALVGVIILFLIYFPAPRLLLIALTPILFGVVWTAAAIHLLFGYLNLMSSIFLVVLIGMGIDFSVHLSARFLELRRSGLGAAQAAAGSVERAGRAIVTGAITSAGAFLSVGWCGFRGIEELGIAAATGLLVTVTAAIVILPAVLALFGPTKGEQRQGFPGLGRLARGVTRWPALVLVGAVGLSLGLGWLARKTPFDFSLLNLLPKDAESAVLMREMVEKRELSADAIVSVAESLDEARQREEAFKRLPTVHRAVSAATFLPPDQDERLAKVRTIVADLRTTRETAQAEPQPAPPLPEALEELTEAIEKLSELVFTAKLSKSVDNLEAGLEAIERLSERLASDRERQHADEGLRRFDAEVDEMLEGFVGRLDAIVEQGPIVAEDLPESLRSRFVSPRGRYAVYAIPEASIWDREELGAFVEEARSVDPEVTGFPETFYENSGLIREGFLKAAVYASIAVLLLLLIDLRRLRYVIFAAVPVACGALWMLGAMYLVGLPYNLANIVGLPLIIGVGIDNGVHLLHRYLQERNVVRAAIRTGGAVMLSSLTTMLGFGSLAFASHRGYSSLGGILFLGVGACLLSAMTVLPAALAWFEEGQ